MCLKWEACDDMGDRVRGVTPCSYIYRIKGKRIFFIMILYVSVS